MLFILVMALGFCLSPRLVFIVAQATLLFFEIITDLSLLGVFARFHDLSKVAAWKAFWNGMRRGDFRIRVSGVRTSF